jgi:hypothetical protein
MLARSIGLAMAAFFAASTAIADDTTCSALADSIVDTATRDVLTTAVKENPQLKKLEGNDLASAAGKLFLTAERPDFKAYGYMMLLWYGGKDGRDLVSEVGAQLQTEEDRAHFYFVLGLFQLRSTDAKIAATGRDYVRQMRDSGKVTFVNDAMWDQLAKCQLPS